MTDVDVERLRQLLDAAQMPTDLRVRYDNDSDGALTWSWAQNILDVVNFSEEQDLNWPEMTTVNGVDFDPRAEYVSAALIALPALLDEIEKLRAQNVLLNDVAVNARAFRTAVYARYGSMVIDERRIALDAALSVLPKPEITYGKAWTCTLCGSTGLYARFLHTTDVCEKYRCEREQEDAQEAAIAGCLCVHAIQQTPGAPVQHDSRCEFYTASTQ